MDDIVIGQIGALVFGIAITALFLAALVTNPDEGK